MRTTGVIAGVIATASATIFPFVPYSNKTTVVFATANDKESATVVGQQVLEGDDAFVTADVTISTAAAKADKVSWAHAFARGATKNPPDQASLRCNIWLTKAAAGDTYSATSKHVNTADAANRAIAGASGLTVAQQLDLASDSTKFAVEKSGLMISGAKFTTGSAGNKFDFTWKRSIRSTEPRHLMIEGTYLTQAAW